MTAETGGTVGLLVLANGTTGCVAPTVLFTMVPVAVVMVKLGTV